ncbi:MAG TPA: hypothetical protein DEB06_07080 [Phycisphaerales bacterium]|nr:hypothetical protein [Phycisphaerales bacterium]
MQKQATIVAAVVLGALGASAAHAGILIDSFNTDQTLQIDPGGVNPSSMMNGVATGAESIGGARAAMLMRTDGLQLLSTRVNITKGLLEFGAEPGVGGSVTVWYDGDSDTDLNPSGLGGADLTDGGIDDALSIAFRYDLAIDMTVRVYSGEGAVSELTFSFAGPAGFVGPFNTAILPYAAFVPVVGAGADFTNVGAISFFASTGEQFGADFQLDDIKTVPSPGAALALLALTGLKRRRR